MYVMFYLELRMLEFRIKNAVLSTSIKFDTHYVYILYRIPLKEKPSVLLTQQNLYTQIFVTHFCIIKLDKSNSKNLTTFVHVNSSL